MESHNANMQIAPDRLNTLGFLPLKWMLGVVSLALRSGSELTRLVAEMHGAATQTPHPLARDVEIDTERLPKAYFMIRALLDYGADRIHHWVDELPSREHPPLPMRRLRSVTNGIVGDKLREWGHPLALDMQTVDQDGHPLPLSELQRKGSRGVVLFVHGLCLSEFDWQGPDHHRFVEDLQMAGFSVGWVRYNSGLAVWENGKQFARFLAQQWASDSGQDLVLVGHSMGGLIIRSAMHQASQLPIANWRTAVTHAAYLATPHAGAPMERVGNFANSLLGVSPYSKPLMALGNIRSLGIRSLRHGNIVEPEHDIIDQQPVPFDEQVNHFLLATSISNDPAKRWLGDGLVPVSSAMGKGHFPQDHPNVTRTFIENAGHMRLLQDVRTYAALREWLQLKTIH